MKLLLLLVPSTFAALECFARDCELQRVNNVLVAKTCSSALLHANIFAPKGTLGVSFFTLNQCVEPVSRPTSSGRPSIKCNYLYKTNTYVGGCQCVFAEMQDNNSIDVVSCVKYDVPVQNNKYHCCYMCFYPIYCSYKQR